MVLPSSDHRAVSAKSSPNSIGRIEKLGVGTALGLLGVLEAIMGAGVIAGLRDSVMVGKRVDAAIGVLVNERVDATGGLVEHPAKIKSTAIHKQIRFNLFVILTSNHAVRKYSTINSAICSYPSR